MFFLTFPSVLAPPKPRVIFLAPKYIEKALKKNTDERRNSQKDTFFPQGTTVQKRKKKFISSSISTTFYKMNYFVSDIDLLGTPLPKQFKRERKTKGEIEIPWGKE